MSKPVPHAVELIPTDAVPGERHESHGPVSVDGPDGPEPGEQRVRVRRGWLVDVDQTKR